MAEETKEEKAKKPNDGVAIRGFIKPPPTVTPPSPKPPPAPPPKPAPAKKKEK